MMFACWLAVVGWAPGAQAGDETEFLAAAPPILSARVLVDAGRETGPVDIPVQLTLSRPADEAFMVPLHVEGDSATAGADFTPVTRALQFERGVMTRTVTIDVRDDPEDEPREELLSVHLGTPQPLDDAGAIPALLVTPVTPAVIIDNDTRLGLEVNSAAEGETAIGDALARGRTGERRRRRGFRVRGQRNHLGAGRARSRGADPASC
jgi:hypothetical protein